MDKFTTLRGIAAPLLRTNIDTGAIIAPVFMLSRSIDLGAKLFSNWRYTMDGAEVPDFVLNQPRYRKAQILLAGPNFGCGSSRRGRGLGADALRHPLRHRAELRRNLLQQRLPERTATGDAAGGGPVHQLADVVTTAPEPVLTVDLNRCVVQPPSGRGDYV